MRQAAHWNLASLRAVLFLAGSGLAMMSLLLASCDEVERHRMLTFFFDGVPPLHSQGSGAGVSRQKDTKTVDTATSGGWYIHEALKNCTNCHGEQRRMIGPKKVQLVAEVPQLCYRCHEEFSALETWVHGPVATGDCLLCHNPHKTKTEFLLKKPAPELCFQCHDVQAVRAAKNHADESYAICIDCHDGHAGATKSLLRQTFLQRPAGLEYQSEIHRRKYEEASRKARSDLLQGHDFLAVSRTILDYIEDGQLWPARAYLEALLNSNLVADAERSPLSEILRQIVALQTSPPVEAQQDPNAPSPSAIVRGTVAATLRAVRDQRSEEAGQVAELYYRSIQRYRAGQLVEAREGFRQVLGAISLPAPMKETAQTYLDKIEETITKQQEQAGWRLLN